MEKLLRKNMWKTWQWDDLLAIFLVLMTFASIVAVIPLVRIAPAFKRVKASEDCETLCRAIKLLSRLRRRNTLGKEILDKRTTLLYTWKGTSSVADSIDRWPRVNEAIRPWRYYRAIANDFPIGCLLGATLWKRASLGF